MKTTKSNNIDLKKDQWVVYLKRFDVYSINLEKLYGLHNKIQDIQELFDGKIPTDDLDEQFLTLSKHLCLEADILREMLVHLVPENLNYHLN